MAQAAKEKYEDDVGSDDSDLDDDEEDINDDLNA